MPSHLVSGESRRDRENAAQQQNVQNSSGGHVRGEGPVEDMTRESPTPKNSGTNSDLNESSPQ